MLLSICMIVKNEEKYLEKCLTGLTEIKDYIETEIIIVDTGSTDNTVEIAKKYTNKIYFHSWENDFAKARNISIGYASGEWVLIIDADECIENIDDMINFFKNTNSKKYAAAFLIIKNLLGNGDEKSYSTVLRLFKRKGLNYVGSIHESPQFEGEVTRLKTEIIHYGYLQTDKEKIKNKYIRNSELLKDEIEKNPKDILLRYYLSTTYRTFGETKEAYEQVKMAYNIAKKENLKIYPFIYTQLTVCQIENEDYTDIKKVSLEGLTKYPTHIDLYYCLAKTLGLEKRYDEALTYYYRYLELVEKADAIINDFNGEIDFLFLNRIDEVFTDIAIINFDKGNYDLAKEYALKVDSENYKKTAMRIIQGVYRNYLINDTKLSDKDYINIFIDYIQNGIQFINKYYDSEIIENEISEKFESSEDLFFIYINKVQSNNCEKTARFEYLKKAVSIFPQMSRGIKYMIKSIM